MNWQHDFAEVNGIRIHYHRSGGDKPALLLLHGITDNGLCFQRVANALTDSYDCILVDARGHGLSDKPEEGYHSDDYAGDFAGLIEHLGVGPALVIGHSLGAVNAAALAANHPQLVRGAVLEDPPFWDRNAAARTSPEDQARNMQEWRAGLMAQQQQSLAEVIAAGRERSPKWSADEFPQWAWAKQQVYPFVVGKSSLRTWDDLVPHIQCPALLVTGDTGEGGIVTQELAQQIAADYPRISHVHIPNTGHNIRRDDFETYVASVRAFLASLNDSAAKR